MAEIISFIRGALTVDVAFKENGAIETRRFRKTMTDEQIIAEVTGKSPGSPANSGKPDKEALPPTVKMTRKMMLDALKKAGIADFDASRLDSVKAAFDKMPKEEKVARK